MTTIGYGAPKVGGEPASTVRAHFRIDGIVKSFGATDVLHGLTLDVARGELVCLLGPSGCGKSTLLNVIAGVLAPDRGSVHLGERDITTMPIQRRNIGVVFQSYALFPNMNVVDNVAFGLRARGVGRDQARAEVDRLLLLVGLVGRGSHRPSQLSGGEQQRVALARALATNPALLLLDEPFSNLDAALRTELRAQTRRIQRETRVTTIMVTHDQTEAFELADRVALMRAGEFVQVGTPQELYDHPRTEFAAKFVGEANVLRGPIVADGDGRVIVFAGNRVPVGALTAGPLPGEHGTLVVRPERVRIAASTEVEEAAGRRVRVAGRITELQYRGSGCRYVVGLGDGSALAAWHTGDRVGRYLVGDEVVASWDLADTLVLGAPDDHP